MILREIKNIFIKNRLTEGVDFKRYEWLKGDTVAYIDTGVNPSFGDELNATFTFSSKPTVRSIQLLVANDNANVVGIVTGLDFYKTGRLQLLFKCSQVGEDAYIVWGSLTTIKEYYMYMRLNNAQVPDTIIKVDGVSRDYATVGTNIISEVPFTTYKIGKSYQTQTGLDTAKMKNITISSKINLTPCQLLKSIPSSLDANNIARSAGECGMYDSISGKFYGNVASTGTFTVEGDVEPETHTGLQQIYQNKLIEGVDYETYDWLKADIPIDTSMISLPISSKNFEFQRNFIQLMNSGYFITSDSNANTDYSYFITDFANSPSADLNPKIWDGKKLITIYHSRKNIGLGIHTIVANDNGVTISSVTNTASLPWYGTPKNIIFNNVNNINKNTICLTSSIKVDGVTRYVPCTLLHPIPRNLDAQCKERLAGECGMIDLISGKFYGNVANSGTFTVENDSNE